jgi:hypothetical protein
MLARKFITGKFSNFFLQILYIFDHKLFDLALQPPSTSGYQQSAQDHRYCKIKWRLRRVDTKFRDKKFRTKITFVFCEIFILFGEISPKFRNRISRYFNFVFRKIIK